MYKAKMIFGGRKMFCTECGYKLEGKVKFCPNCGTKVMKIEDEEYEQRCVETPQKIKQPENEEERLEYLIEEIFWKRPGDYVKNSIQLSDTTGMSYREASRIMTEKWKIFKKERKEGKYPDTQYCPYCGSQNIGPYETAAYTRTTKVNFFGESYHTEIIPGKVSATSLQCRQCNHIWTPKRKKK